MLEAMALPATALIAGGAGVIIMRLRTRRSPGDETIARLADAVDDLRAQTHGVRAALDEIHDRLDVTDRVLTRGAPPRNDPPS
jgi:hypothetical protein